MDLLEVPSLWDCSHGVLPNKFLRSFLEAPQISKKPPQRRVQPAAGLENVLLLAGGPTRCQMLFHSLMSSLGRLAGIGTCPVGLSAFGTVFIFKPASFECFLNQNATRPKHLLHQAEASQKGEVPFSIGRIRDPLLTRLYTKVEHKLAIMIPTKERIL